MKLALRKSLRLSQGLALPIEACTQTFLVVGKRGSGKSTTAARLVEQLHRARVPFIVLDPVDTWYGLKASRHGGPGLEVYVFGGRHADLPLEPGTSALLAELVCEHHVPVVLSVKHLSGRERSRFMVDFARTLFQKWAGGVLHLVLEEAHELAPQQPYKGEEEMLGAFKRLWKLGRSSGIGGTAITQRPAALHKDITTQAEILIVHRTIGPQDVAAVREWIRYHGEKDDILPQLATLKTGEAFVWAPDFPEASPIGLKRVRIQPRVTYDSSATPKAGEIRSEPRNLAPVDLERLRKKMAATIERAKADDPRELRQRIAHLEDELKRGKALPRPVPTPEIVKARTVEVPVVKPAEVKRVELIVHRLETISEKTLDALKALRTVMARAQTPPMARMASEPFISPPAPFTPALRDQRRVVSDVPAVPRGNGADLRLGPRKILTAIAQYGGVTREQLGVLTGYRRTSRETYLKYLKTDGRIEQRGEQIVATAAGLADLGDSFEALPTGSGLRDYWLSRLRGGELRIFKVVLGTWPEPVSREHIDEVTGYKRTSRETYLKHLRARRLVEKAGRGLRASPYLFKEGASVG